MWFLALAGLCALNAILWTLFPGEAMIGVDSLIAAAAIFGVSSCEWWMLRATVALHCLALRYEQQARLYRALTPPRS